MLQLSAQQLEQIERLQTQRHVQGVAQVLAEAWPEVAERLQTRWPAFVAAALAQAHEMGLAAPADLARYASLCCLWGVGFEAKPGFEWAQQTVADLGRSPSLRLHQLLQGSSEALAQHAPGPGPGAAPLTPGFLAKTLAAIEVGMARQQGARAVFLDLPEAPPLQACDLASLTLALVEPHPLQAYHLLDGAWRRVDLPRLVPEPQHWSQSPPERAPLPLVSRALGAGAAARLNLALQTLAVCNPLKHPEVMHRSAQGPLVWRGPDTARLSLALHAPAAAPVDPQRGPTGIAHAAAPDVQSLHIDSCGVRDAGAPFGEVNLVLPVYAATQHLCEVRHGPMARVSLPAPAPAPAAAGVSPGPLLCTLQADGVPQAVAAWEQAWRGLQVQCRAGLEKLHNAWARAMTGSAAPQLEGELSPLVGQAGITWGWQRSAANAVALRVEGQLDWAAVVVDLQLSGELAWEGATARLQLQARGRTEWAATVRQSDSEAQDGEGLADAHTTWRHPWVLGLAAVASGEPAMLSALPLPEALQGALVGECGLRPRPDGQGWQWFYRLTVEAVHVALVCTDPLLGEQRCQRELLPAMTLVDWSAG